MVMFQSNYIGESEASQIINTNTVGDKPLPPLQSDFIIVNTSLAILRLDKWQQLSCPILYFVIEYKLRSETPWTIGNSNKSSPQPTTVIKVLFCWICEVSIGIIIPVTNNLQLQDVYSIRGLAQGTSYDLKAGRWHGDRPGSNGPLFAGDGTQPRGVLQPAVPVHHPQQPRPASTAQRRPGWGLHRTRIPSLALHPHLNSLFGSGLTRSLLLY